MGNDQSNAEKKDAKSAYHPDIIVVSNNINKSSKTHTHSAEDNESNRLKYIPLFYPVIKSSIGLKDDEDLIQISAEDITKLCNRFQTHLNICADTVMFDQNALVQRIKEIDFVVNTLMQSYVERQRKYAKYCEQFLAIKDISNNLKKIQRNIDELIPMMDEINNFLPENERLENFSLKTV